MLKKVKEILSMLSKGMEDTRKIQPSQSSRNENYNVK